MSYGKPKNKNQQTLSGSPPNEYLGEERWNWGYLVTSLIHLLY
jgi:hypothetical protein